jgi:hypothetical protein
MLYRFIRTFCWRKGEANITLLVKNGDITYPGIIPIIINNQKNMKKRQVKIKSFVNSLENNNHWYIISIVFDNTTYFRKLNNINEFYKRLSNSKSSLSGHLSNRLFWKRLMPTGIYEPILTDEKLILNFIMTTKSKLNELELKSRAKKICSYDSIKISYQDNEELVNISSSTYFHYRQNIQLFGEAKKESYISK